MDAAALPELIARYGGNLPRYTSYPTAASFTDAVGSPQVESWLAALPDSEPVSLYFHVPFCDELCRFCGCNTSVMRHDSGRSAYADLLRDELARVARLMGSTRTVRHVQFGGGTPTTLPPDALRALMRDVHALFRLDAGAELSMEMDPRHVPAACPPLLGELGFNRISLGVQDLDPRVQEACGRLQSFEQTRDCISQVRAAGVSGVNIDLIYGLPYQSVESVARTARSIASLRPDRLAVFGYAHVPWKQKRQQLIPTQSLPGSAERLAQRAQMDVVLKQEGYVPVGLDHYALPADPLAQAARTGTLHRNFQGYTTDSCTALLGIGASAVSMLPQGFAQNVVSPAGYARALAAGPGLPVARGVARTAQDRQRGAIIERIMCDLGVDLGTQTADATADFAGELAAMAPFVRDGLVSLAGPVIRVTEKGRPFLRNVAAVFDTHRAGLAAQSGGGAAAGRFSSTL